MDTEAIRRKPGPWTEQEVEAVYCWLVESRKLDEFVKYAYGLMARRRAKDLVLAEDVVLTKVAYALRRTDLYDPSRYHGKKDPFLNWLYVLIARAAGRRANRQWRVQAAEDSFRPRPPKRHGRPMPAPTPLPRPDFDWDGLRPFVDKLRPRYQEAFVLFYEKGLSCAQAAQESQWHCKRGAMKVRLHRARHELIRLRQEGGAQP